MSDDYDNRGLLPGQVAALRRQIGDSEETFAEKLGVTPRVVERWERQGVPSGPNALVLRMVARTEKVALDEADDDGDEECRICGSAARDRIVGQPICSSCHNDPIAPLLVDGWDLSRVDYPEAKRETISCKLPDGRTQPLTGTFASEGFTSLMTRLFGHEPQVGHESFDAAVFVKSIDDPSATLEGEEVRELLKALVEYGVVRLEPSRIEVQRVPDWYQERDVILLAALLGISLLDRA